jgi:hypothetical protein
VKVRLTAVAIALSGAAAAIAVTTGGGPELPEAGAFHEGRCRQSADAVLALGRFTHRHADAKTLPADAYPFLRHRAEELAAVRNLADSQVDPLQQALSPRIDAVLTAIGFIRLRPGRAYDRHLLRDLESARSDLQHTCTEQA